MVVVDPKLFARTERLLLRPLRLDDAEDILLMRSHPECMKHTSLLPSDDLESTKSWIQGVCTPSLSSDNTRSLTRCSATTSPVTGTSLSNCWQNMLALT